MKPTWWNRFWSYVEYVDGCLIWIGRKNKKGYGWLWVNGSYKRAHKLLWEWLNGPVPAGKELGHTCENKNCLLHVRPITHLENMGEAELHKGRCKEGHLYNRKDKRGWNKCDTCRTASKARRAS